MRILLVLTCLSLSACKTESTSTDLGVLAFASIGETVFVGKVYSKSGGGRIEIQALNNQVTKCSGKYRFNSSSRGKASFECTDGDRGSLRVRQESNWKGSATGTSAQGDDVVAVFGYSIEEANAKLVLPKGTHLVEENAQISLADI